MNQEEYLQACLRTWNKVLTKKERIANATLGACGEHAEYRYASDNEMLDELGDVLYYITVLAWELRINIDDFFSCSTRVIIPFELWRLCELVKKHTFHGKDVIADIEVVLMNIIHGIRYRDDISWDDVRRFNVEKLLKRYPDGFVSASDMVDVFLDGVSYNVPARFIFGDSDE